MRRIASKTISSLASTIAAAIRARGTNVTEIARLAGVTQPSLHCFLAGKRGLTLASAERLCEWLGLELVQRDRGDVQGDVQGDVPNK